MIEINTDGTITIGAGHVFEWTCPRTGDDMTAAVADFATADALVYAVTMGLKQGSSDAYAGIKSTAKAAEARDTKLARILAGTVGTGGGGRRGDVIGDEAVSIILAESGMSRAAWGKDYKKGKSVREAINAYVTDAVTAALTAAAVDGAEMPDTATVTAIIERNESRIIGAAAVAVEARKVGAPTITLDL